MTAFRHRRVGTDFIQECEEIVFSGGSVVLLGPRFGGKRFVQNRLVESLTRKTSVPVVSFSVPDSDHGKALETIRCRTSGGDERAGQLFVGDPFAAVTELSSRYGQPVVLVGGNIDQLSQDLARDFLRRVRRDVEARKIVAVLSGELDFRDLVHGPHSEFNCAEQFVLQGFDRETFSEHFRADATASGVQWTDPGRICERMWELTNGNWHVSRFLMAVASDMSLENQRLVEDITEEVIDRALEADSIGAEPWTGVLTRPAEVIAAEPECCRDLEALLEADRVQARSVDGAPGVLELAGIAIRVDSDLRFASPFMRRLSKHYFWGRRLADLFAHSGQWSRAFERYSKLDSSQLVRPTGADDRRAVKAMLQALGSAMFAETRNGVDGVCDLFSNGARYLLGFSEVSFWERLHTWTAVSKTGDLGDASIRQLAAVLPTSLPEPGVIPLPESVARFAVAAALQSDIPERQVVVVLSGLGSRQVLSRERHALAVGLAENFVQAHSQAIKAEVNRKRLETRDQHVAILNRVFDFLGGAEFDVRQILELTGNELLKLGYRRVMFSLVDPQHQRIAGILDCPPHASVRLAEYTDFSLTEPPTDVQPYAILSAKTMRIENALREPLVNTQVRDAAHLRGFAVVPILGRLDQAVGTIHIERDDGECPTQQQVQDLELFGRQLARILALHERMTLVQKSLDASAEPMMIANHGAGVVYVNKTAAKLFEVEAGWQDEPRQLFPRGSKVDDAIRWALKGHRAVRQIQGLGSDQKYRGEVVSDSLKDWRGETIGAFVDVHRSVLNVLDALTKIGPAPDPDSAIEAIMDAFASFGYQQVRMYVVDPAQGRLRSHRARGLSTDKMAWFQRGAVVLDSGDESAIASLPLNTKQATLFYYGEPDDKERGIKYTDFGIEARALPKSTFPPAFHREPGAYWLSLPLLTGEEPFGKITIMCDGRLPPDVLEAMKLLAARTSELLLARQENEKRANQRELDIREGVEISMSAVSHNLGSRLASLPVILGRYRLEEARHPGLRDINDDFAFLVDHALSTISRTRELLSKISVRYQQFDLSDMVGRVLHASLSRDQYQLEVSGSLMIEADPHLIESSLVELIQNSKQFAREPLNLAVGLRLYKCAQAGQVCIDFHDNGPGIATEYKARVFEPFFAHRPGMTRSTGLGLAFVRRAVEAHGGTICEDGVPGQGVRFHIEIELSSDKD
jgi:signal transduction histidine kinase